MEFSKVENLRAYRAIVDQVCDSILRGDLQVGDWLPSEREVASQSGLSRSSVRQAFQEMKEAGLVEMSVGAGGGTQIVSDRVPQKLLSEAFEMSRQRLLDLSETRIALELAAVEMAAARATKGEIKALWQVCDEMERLVEVDPHNKEAYRRIDLSFHQLVLKITRNEVLIDIYTSILPHILTVIDMSDVTEMEAYGLPTMKKVVDAIERRSPLEARAAMFAHVSPLTDFIKRFFQTESQEEFLLAPQE